MHGFYVSKVQIAGSRINGCKSSFVCWIHASNSWYFYFGTSRAVSSCSYASIWKSYPVELNDLALSRAEILEENTKINVVISKNDVFDKK